MRRCCRCTADRSLCLLKPKTADGPSLVSAPEELYRLSLLFSSSSTARSGAYHMQRPSLYHSARTTRASWQNVEPVRSHGSLGLKPSGVDIPSPWMGGSPLGRVGVPSHTGAWQDPSSYASSGFERTEKRSTQKNLAVHLLESSDQRCQLRDCSEKILECCAMWVSYSVVYCRYR